MALTKIRQSGIATGVLPIVKSAFSAGLASDQAISGTTKINFVANATLFQNFDLNSDFDNTANKFTAPVAGIYIFQVTLYDVTSSQQVYGIQMFVNNGRKQNLVMTKANSPSNESYSGGTTVWKADVGDYIQMYAVPSGDLTISANQFHTYWFGYLLGGV